MKYLILVLLLASPAYAGNDKGNGGDGIVMPNGSIQLFDLFERMVDADKRIDFEPRDDIYTNELRYQVEKILRGKDPFFAAPLSAGDEANLEKRVAQVASGFSEVISRVDSQAFQIALANELKKLQWNQTPVDLQPNVDTSPFLDLTGYKRIGCARNRNGVILYSVNCVGPRMSEANIVALLLHEAIYSLYRQRFPDSNDSFDVRTLTAKIIGSVKVEDSELRELGFADIVDSVKPWEKYFSFYEGEKGWTCSFVTEQMPKMTLSFRFQGLAYVAGTVALEGYYNSRLYSYGENRFIAGKQPDDPSDVWFAGLPSYESNDTVALRFFTEGDESIDFRLHVEGPEAAKISGTSNNSEYNEEFSGDCVFKK